MGNVTITITSGLNRDQYFRFRSLVDSVSSIVGRWEYTLSPAGEIFTIHTDNVDEVLKVFEALLPIMGVQYTILGISYTQDLRGK